MSCFQLSKILFQSIVTNLCAGYWRDIGCDYTQGYFCSMTPQTGSGSATATISVDDCPDNGWPYSWRVYGDMCYTFGDIGMTWDNAKTQCETAAKSHFH